MKHQIVKADNGKFSLYIDGVLFAQYTRKSDALRGFHRYQAKAVEMNNQTTSPVEEKSKKPQMTTGQSCSRKLFSNMKTLLATVMASSALLMPVGASAMPLTNPAVYTPPDLLTGDVRTACEAILCLSTGERPHECSAPLRRYFSIKHKKLHDTIKARKNFLQLCPSDDAGMHGVIDALANGAGRCDADELNRVMRRRFHLLKGSYIRNAKPAYCTAYFEHGWTTVGDKVRYVGTEKNGGRWVNVR